MTEDKKNGRGEVCACVGCQGGMMAYGYGKHWTFFLLRTLITIIILMMVFWFGVMAGRLNSGFGHDGRGIMMMGGTMMTPGGMMRINGATSSPSMSGFPNTY